MRQKGTAGKDGDGGGGGGRQTEEDSVMESKRRE